MTVCGIKHADGVCVMGKCPHFNKCCPVVWDKSGKPPTNEEWFDNLSIEEKAKVLRRKTYGNGEDNEREEQGWINWLKAKHEDNPPDIPSVPSWDRWLKGEKSKCELCNGSGEVVECNLAGRLECPKTPKTKQDWMQSCNTEQLARELAFIDGYDDVDFDVLVKKWIKWLKQPHMPKE